MVSQCTCSKRVRKPYTSRQSRDTEHMSRSPDVLVLRMHHHPPQNDVRYDDDELMQLYEYYRKLEHRLAEQQRVAANRKDYY